MRHVSVRRLTAVIAVVAMALAVVATPSGPAAAQSNEFGDVPDDAYYTETVAALAARGVFAGTECDDGFCPSEAIDRKTMAVWIVRVLDGDDPPALAQTRFNDVDAASFYAPFIERMAELEVTTGCGDGSGFCPDRSVTGPRWPRSSPAPTSCPTDRAQALPTFPPMRGTRPMWPGSRRQG